MYEKANKTHKIRQRLELRGQTPLVELTTLPRPLVGWGGDTTLPLPNPTLSAPFTWLWYSPRRLRRLGFAVPY